MPNVPIACLPPSRVDAKVQGLKIIIVLGHAGSSQATNRPPKSAGGLSAAAVTHYCTGKVEIEFVRSKI